MTKLTFLFLFNVSFLFAQQSWNVSLKYHWNDSTLPGTTLYDNVYNEIWGFHVGGHDYAVIGSTMGTHIFDITDTDSVFLRSYIAGAAQGTQIIHRDYHDYKGYLYMICQEGASTIQILDISDLPDSVSLAYDSDSVFSQAHNIYIDTAKDMMYAGYVKELYPPNDFGVTAYDMTNPLSPVKVYQSNTDVHDFHARNDTVYFNAAYTGLEVYDFSNSSSPTFLGSLTGYNYQGYNHSGWPTEDGKYYIMADENHGFPMKVLDVQDFNNIQVKNHFSSGVDVNSIPHNQIIMGDYLFVAYYYDGFYVYNISDPENPSLSAYYDTYPSANGQSYKGAWGVFPFLGMSKILISDMQTGLYVFDVTDTLSSNNSAVSKELSWSLYPNPCEDNLNLNISDISDTPILKIVDLKGRQLVSKKLFKESDKFIDVSSLSSGNVYFCTLEYMNGEQIGQRAFYKK